MANKLAGQRAKFTSALKDFNATEDGGVREHAIDKMAQVLAEAPLFGFTEAEVTQGRDVPTSVAARVRDGYVKPRSKVEVEAEDESAYVADVETAVDVSAVREFGSGASAVYAYGYRCAPGRLKIGRTDGDVVARVTTQTNTSTPDRPRLELIFRTEQPGALERALHAWFQLRRRTVVGGGREWYAVDRDEVVEAYRVIVGAD